MENKQTAVEWLLDNLNFEPYDEEEFISNNKMWEQAKQMEEDKIREAYYRGVRDEMRNIGKDFEDYYKETYANDTTKGLPKEDSK